MCSSSKMLYNQRADRVLVTPWPVLTATTCKGAVMADRIVARTPRGYKSEVRPLDAPGTVHGHLTVLEVIRGSHSAKRKRRLRCSCVCGQIVEANATDIYYGRVVSCGCQRFTREIDDTPGKVYGHLTVLEVLPGNAAKPGVPRKPKRLRCRCACGAVCDPIASKVYSGNARSCGCKMFELRRRVQPGQKYGRLTVLEVFIGSKKRPGRALCLCDCGNRTEVNAQQLYQSHVKSCGCLKLDMIRERATTHGRGHDYLNMIWQSIRTRCFNENDKGFRKYGARGISMCDEWRRSFVAFAEAVGERPSPEYSIDRINPWRGYEPGNVRWATISEQRANQIPYWGNLMTGMRYGFYCVNLTVKFRE